jgi:hypothetical protein
MEEAINRHPNNGKNISLHTTYSFQPRMSVWPDSTTLVVPEERPFMYSFTFSRKRMQKEFLYITKEFPRGGGKKETHHVSDEADENGDERDADHDGDAEERPLVSMEDVVFVPPRKQQLKHHEQSATDVRRVSMRPSFVFRYRGPDVRKDLIEESQKG